LKVALLAGVVVSVGDVLQHLPTVVLVLTVFCGFGLALLVLTNERSCTNLIRILKVLLHRNDNRDHEPRKRLARR
jgi:hypothetical protein